MSRSLYRKTGHYCPASGFTLIELMIVVAIVAILAAIAYPSYSHYIIKTRRAAATACVSEYANYMERYYTTNLRYDQDDAGTDNPWPTLECAGAQQTGANYSYTPSTLTASTYIISATPRGPQVADTTCGTLTLNQTGVRTAASDVASCW